ncbi:MAG: hypothetical protein LBF78_02880 [Treponema sp.]|jgi:hypothetical protein|nr:hypothetical protein [Treponema sp.]
MKEIKMRGISKISVFWRAGFNAAFFFFLLMPLMYAFCSCSANVEGVLKEGGAADLAVKTSLEPRMTDLIRRFQVMMGEPGSAALILDGPAISRSMASAPGIESVFLANDGPAGLDGAVKVKSAGDFLAVAGRSKKFVTFTEKSGSRPSGQLVIALDLESAPELISLLSGDAAAYLAALNAPAASGDAQSRQEYLLFVAALYGKPIADEISAAKIHAVLDFPGPVTSIQGGVSSGNRAVFTVPLLDLLVLDKPLRYEVNW